MKRAPLFIRLAFIAFLMPLGLTASRYACAAESAPRRIPVMIVGLAHFVAHADLHNSKFADVMDPAHQRQIEEVVRNIARFRPTKVMIEQPIGDEKIVLQYRQYLDGKFTLGANEVYQLGFRLATLSGNKDIYPIDTNTDFPFDFDGVKASAKQHGQTAILVAAEAHVAPFLQRENDLEQHGTIAALLRYLNKQTTLDAFDSWYMYIDRIGHGKDYAGADLVSYWYARNLHIYANIRRSIDSASDRVVLLMGAGHVQQLRDYVRLSPDLEWVDPQPYLSMAVPSS